MFAVLDVEVQVYRNDALDADQAERLEPTHLVISPGPSRPETAGNMPAILARLAPTTPILGVCLGQQAIVQLYGGHIELAHELVHGKTRPVHHHGQGVCAGLPEPFAAGRYHSLAAVAVPDCLEITAWAADEEVMGVRHRELPIEGVQFHPESILTPDGGKIAANFLAAYPA